MLLVILLSVLTVLVTYIYVRWLSVRRYWATRGVPHVPPNPLTGSMTFLFKENASLWFRRVYDTYKAPYVGIWIFWRPGLLVNSPDVAKNILIRDQANFRNRFATSGNADPLGRLNLFTLDDPLWTVIRKRLSILFTSSKLKGVDILITEKSKELVERIQKDRQSGEPIDTRNLMTDYSTDIVGTSSFGIVSDAMLTGTSEIKHITQVLMHFDLKRGLAWCCGFFIPELANLLRLKLFPQYCIDHMRRILRMIIAQRGGLENKVTEPKDLLDILIKIKQENSDELDMSENMMLAQASVFVQGGFDTTATTLTFIVYELAFHPEIQEKLYKELKEAKDKPVEDEMDSFAQLTFLNCVIKEGLRKYTLIPYLDRVALEDYKVDDHLTIKAGTPVYINLVGIHYDPEIYPEPDKFNPDRFLAENKSDKPYTFLAFGEGPRKCIGQRLGLSSVRHAIAAIVLNYELKPLPNSPRPADVPLDRTGLTVVPDIALHVDFVPRKS